MLQSIWYPISGLWPELSILRRFPIGVYPQFEDRRGSERLKRKWAAKRSSPIGLFNVLRGGFRSYVAAIPIGEQD